MSRKVIDTVITICGALINTIPFCCSLIVFYAMLFREPVPVQLVLFVAGYVVLTELIRSYINKVFLYLSMHIIPLVLFVWGVSMQRWDKLVTGFFLMVVFLFAMVQKLRRAGKSRAYHPALICVVLAGTYLIPSTCHVMALGRMYLALFFIELFFRQFDQYLEKETMTNHQVREGRLLLQSGSMALCYGVPVYFAVILLSDEQAARTLGDRVLTVLLGMIRFVVSLFHGKTESMAGQPDTARQQLVMDDLFRKLGPEKEMSLFWIILERIMIVGGCLLMIAAAIYLIRWLIHTFLQSFAKRQEQEDVVEDLRIEDKQMSLAGKRRTSLWRSLVHPATNQEKIRRSYLHFMKRLDKEGKLQAGKASSARETLSDHVEDEKQGQQFATLYEKARYSKEPCGAEEVRAAGKMSRTMVTK